MEFFDKDKVNEILVNVQNLIVGPYSFGDLQFGEKYRPEDEEFDVLFEEMDHAMSDQRSENPVILVVDHDMEPSQQEQETDDEESDVDQVETEDEEDSDDSESLDEDIDVEDLNEQIEKVKESVEETEGDESQEDSEQADQE